MSKTHCVHVHDLNTALAIERIAVQSLTARIGRPKWWPRMITYPRHEREQAELRRKKELVELLDWALTGHGTPYPFIPLSDSTTISTSRPTAETRGGNTSALPSASTAGAVAGVTHGGSDK